MLRKQAEEAISKAIQDFTIKKISDFKARKGYKIVHVRYIPGVVTTTDPKYRILGRGYFWSENGEKKLCYALEVPVDEAIPLIRDFEKVKGENRRKNRHRIWNKKRTKLIMCPFTNSCNKCPFANHPEEIYPSEAETHQELSYDEINDEKLSVAPGGYGSEESILYNLETQEMMKAIRSLNNQTLFKFVSLLRQGYEYDEIMEELGLDLEDIRTCYIKYIKYKKIYVETQRD